MPASCRSPTCRHWGNQDYCHDLERLSFGDRHPVLAEGRVVSAQTPGAGGGLRAAAEFVSRINPDATIWASTPVWDHQLEFFDKAGLPVRRYRYYDTVNSVLQFDEMLQDLEGMRRDDVLLLHGCCHNPTGEDLRPEHWQAVAEVANRRGAIPLVDVAYQGFGDGIEEDVTGLRIIAGAVPQMILAVSSSKSFRHLP